MGQYLLLLRLGAVAVVVALAGWGGYDYGAARVQSAWDSERAKVSGETASALTTLAGRYKDAAQQAIDAQQAFLDADRRYQEEREKKQQVVTKTVTRIRYEAQKLPARDCPLLPDTRRLLVRAYCAAADPGGAAGAEGVPATAADPECLPEPVPGPDAASAGWK